MLTDRTNDERAQMGEKLVDTMARGHGGEYMPVVTCIEQALESIAHCCDRFGLPPAETFRDALRAYRRDLEDGPRAATVASGESILMTEVADVACAR